MERSKTTLRDLFRVSADEPARADRGFPSALRNVAEKRIDERAVVRLDLGRDLPTDEVRRLLLELDVDERRLPASLVVLFERGLQDATNMLEVFASLVGTLEDGRHLQDEQRRQTRDLDRELASWELHAFGMSEREVEPVGAHSIVLAQHHVPRGDDIVVRRKNVDDALIGVAPALRLSPVGRPTERGQEQVNLRGVGDDDEIDVLRLARQGNMMTECGGTDHDDPRRGRSVLKTSEQRRMRRRDRERHELIDAR